MAQRFALLLLVSASVLLMVLARFEYAPLEETQAVITDIFSPLLEAVSHPITAFNKTVTSLVSITNLYDENVFLKQENERLRNWQAQARLLNQENVALRGLLKAQPGPGITYVSGKIIGDSGGPFVRAVLLNAGSGDGVEPGVAAITGDGLVGRVVEVGAKSSRILLLTDLNSRVPVVVENTRHRAILEGNNTETLHLGFLPDTDQVKVGDRIVTSGHGGIFPAGLPVGEITEIDHNIAVVTPFVRLDRLEFVRILLFDFPTMDPASEERQLEGVPLGPRAG